jgi:site-specific DNA-methyltransferase (adenine-specific)
MKKYNIIYTDPPWKYNLRANHKTRFRGGACGYYNLMTMEEIKALPVPDLADKNCALFMWCTFPYLEDQIKLFNHWGFKYKTVAFTWIKTNKNSETNQMGFFTPKVKPFFGVGYYTKSNAEICLLGIKGKMKPISNKVSSAIISPIREHSRKPDEARERIVQLFGDIPRIEMFARQQTQGWDTWGNEVDKFYNQKGYNNV